MKETTQYALSVMGNHIASLWADRIEPRAADDLAAGYWLHIGAEVTGCLTIRPGVELLAKGGDGEWRPVDLTSVSKPDATQSEDCATAQPGAE